MHRDDSEKKQVLAFRRVCPTVSYRDDGLNLTKDELFKQRTKLYDATEAIIQKALDEKRAMTPLEDDAVSGGSLLAEEAEEFIKMVKAGVKPNAYPPDSGRSVATQNINTRIVSPHLETRSFRAMLKKDPHTGLDNGGFESGLNQMLECIIAGRADDRLDALEKRTFIEGSGGLGGYSVPDEFSAQIFDQSLETEIVRPRAAIYPMASAIRHIPAWDGQDHSSNLLGGFSAEWMGENETQSVQTGKLRNMTLQARKLGIYTEASREVLADGLTLEEQIGIGLIKAVGFELDRAFLIGNGVQEPIGAINCDSCISVNRATANQVAYNDIVNMWARLHPAMINGAVWIASPSIIPQLAQVRDSGNNNLWIQSAAAGIPGTLLGLPLLMSEKVAALGSKGDLMLVNFQGYAIGLRAEIVLEKSNAPGWARDVVSFRAILRADGRSLWSEAVKPRNGGSTLSWCVALDTP